MRRFKNILLVVMDGTDPAPAADRALRLAAANGAALTCLDVAEPVPSVLSSLLPPDRVAELEHARTEARAERLAALRAAAEAAGVEARTRLAEGTKFIAAIREVLRGGHDLLVKVAEADGGIEARLWGSTDRHLLRKCPVPVWLVRGGATAPFARILAAVDPEPAEAGQVALSRTVLELASSLARAEGAELHVLHAWRLFGEDLLRGPRTGFSDPELHHLVGQAMNLHQARLDALIAAAPTGGLRVEGHCVRGEPGAAIAQFAAKRAVDLVVMGTVARTGIPGLLIGNTAERALAELGCSVLVLKPEGFVTPVTLDEA